MKVFISMKYFLDFLTVKVSKIAINQMNQNQPDEPKLTK